MQILIELGLAVAGAALYVLCTIFFGRFLGFNKLPKG